MYTAYTLGNEYAVGYSLRCVGYSLRSRECIGNVYCVYANTLVECAVAQAGHVPAARRTLTNAAENATSHCAASYAYTHGCAHVNLLLCAWQG